MKNVWSIVALCTLLALLAGCANPRGPERRENAAEISCDTCAVVAEYGGLVKMAGGVISDRMKEIQVQLGTADVIDGLAVLCEFRNLIVDRRIDAGTAKLVSECDTKRRAS